VDDIPVDFHDAESQLRSIFAELYIPHNYEGNIVPRILRGDAGDTFVAFVSTPFVCRTLTVSKNADSGSARFKSLMREAHTVVKFTVAEAPTKRIVATLHRDDGFTNAWSISPDDNLETRLTYIIETALGYARTYLVKEIMTRLSFAAPVSSGALAVIPYDYAGYTVAFANPEERSKIRFNWRVAKAFVEFVVVESADAPKDEDSIHSAPLPEKVACETEDAIVDLIRSRGEVGREKYGVSMDRSDLSPVQWAQHLQEELSDALQYAERYKGALGLLEEVYKLLNTPACSKAAFDWCKKYEKQFGNHGR